MNTPRMGVASGAMSRRTPRQSFRSRFEEARDQGKLEPGKSYLVLTEAADNHGAFAIMDAFPEKAEAGERKPGASLARDDRDGEDR